MLSPTQACTRLLYKLVFYVFIDLLGKIYLQGNKKCLLYIHLKEHSPKSINGVLQIVLICWLADNYFETVRQIALLDIKHKKQHLQSAECSCFLNRLDIVGLNIIHELLCNEEQTLALPEGSSLFGKGAYNCTCKASRATLDYCG